MKFIEICPSGGGVERHVLWLSNGSPAGHEVLVIRPGESSNMRSSSALNPGTCPCITKTR